MSSFHDPTDPHHFVISYTGIFYPEKDPYTFFRALRSWFDAMQPEARKRMERLLRVRLIGTPQGMTRSIVSSLGLDGVVQFVDRVPHPDAIRLTKQSDLVRVSIGLGHRTRPRWLPSKLFEYLGCGVPILAIGSEGEMMETIRRTNSGYVITSEDHAAVHRILEEEIRRKFDGGTRDRKDGLPSQASRNTRSGMSSAAWSGFSMALWKGNPTPLRPDIFFYDPDSLLIFDRRLASS